jgi:thiamine biosynthesis lipoprotein
VGELRHAEPVMGTVASFLLVGDDEDGLRRATERACALLHHADDVFSIWRADTPLSRLRRGEISLAQAPPELRHVLDRCTELVALSRGWFDPWRMRGGVDPTGFVKGWATQRAIDAVRDAGVRAAMVNAGGDIATFGHPHPGEPWRIGVRHPASADHLTCVAALEDELSAMATSGNYERGEHVYDPFTGEPATRLWSATVVGADLGVADAMATAVFAAGTAGLDVVAALPGYEAWLVLPDGSVASSGGFPAVAP